MRADESFVIVVDNFMQTLEDVKRKAALGMQAIGVEAEGFAKLDCPVDTGRLRNSITFATKDMQSPANTGGFRNKEGGLPAHAEPKDYATHAEPKELTLHLGTNVEYAEAVETRDISHRTGKAHFLRDSLATHGPRYRELLETALQK